MSVLIAVAYLGATAFVAATRTSFTIDPFLLLALGCAWGCALPFLISLVAVCVIPAENEITPNRRLERTAVEFR